MRGSGGVLRFWGELIGEGGQLRLARFGQIDDLNQAGAVRTLRMSDEFLNRYRDFGVAETWQNVNVSPDFPTTGQVVAGLYPQSEARRSTAWSQSIFPVWLHFSTFLVPSRWTGGWSRSRTAHS